ncbi:ATP synthase subunit I [Lysobacter sp. A03]|uniref:N-ATPase subunit AtpR n=1 Tax=Lysobacter sp. A03 TaxID=1199154 RepID=UPI0005B6A26A|nr:ATP synthase subunit I [Lysobacter sp. A03]KIQ96272.1 Sodium-transporting ATPase subunit R [Lysobacter sp. A03]
MNGIDWGAFGLGTVAGAIAGTIFFAGLAFGLRLALRGSRPMPVLALSALLRITALLAAGWLVARAGGAAALAGYALGFLATRFAAVALARPTAPQRDRKCN